MQYTPWDSTDANLSLDVAQCAVCQPSIGAKHKGDDYCTVCVGGCISVHQVVKELA